MRKALMVISLGEMKKVAGMLEMKIWCFQLIW